MTPIWLLAQTLLGITAITGTVQGPEGAAANVRVFLEPGLGGAVRTARTDERGRFRFDGVAPGPAGVFAYAPGYGYAGAHRNVAVADDPEPLTLRLRTAGEVAGTVVDFRGEPVSGARIARIALLGAAPVGIPLDKLEGQGIATPTTGTDGRFSIPNLPAGGDVAIKVAHPGFAQQAVEDVTVGATGLRVVMYPGEMVRGEVLSRDSGLPVSNASVILRSAQPPHDSVVTQTDARGEFGVRLRPGIYLYQTVGASVRSPGWAQLTVPGDGVVPPVTLRVAGIGTLRGRVRDAITGAPVAGARLSLETFDNVADVARTGATGQFVFQVAEGPNSVKLEGAPGYRPPEQVRVRMEVPAGETVEMPDFWLAPIPDFEVTVLDGAGDPAPGVLVSVLRPASFGWRRTDAEGQTTLAVGTMPPSGRVIAMAEHPTRAEGALFSLSSEDAGGARVQLLPLATLRGEVENGSGRGVEGVVVGALFDGESIEEDSGERPTLLWRTVSRRGGAFAWPAVVPGVPLRVAAQAGEATATSVPVNAQPGGTATAGKVVLSGAERGKSLTGDRIDWAALPVQCGPPTGPLTERRPPILLVYAEPAAAAAVHESLETAQDALSGMDLAIVLVVDGAYDCADARLPVLRGTAPGLATVYLLDREGRVALETFGLPPLRALQGLS